MVLYSLWATPSALFRQGLPDLPIHDKACLGFLKESFSILHDEGNTNRSFFKLTFFPT